MTPELKIAIVIALALGIALLAFVASDAYKHILSYLFLGVVWVVFILMFVWTAGVVSALRRLSVFIDGAKGREAMAAIESYKWPFRTLLISFVVANLYLWGLRYFYDLREYLQKRKDEKIIRERGY
jgi:hypothetical protein